MPLYTSYSEETQTQIEEFLEDHFGWDEDQLVDFVERFGQENFKLYFEDIKLCNLLNTHSSTKYIEDYFKPLENKYKALLISDYKFYLPEMMMFKIDRTSMANSLEVRSPFVDHKLIEYIMSNNSTYLNPMNSKEILKKCNVVVAIRPGFRPSDIPAWILHRIQFANIPRFEISSSNIRMRWRENKTIRYLVTLPVWEYINKHNLYS